MKTEEELYLEYKISTLQCEYRVNKIVEYFGERNIYFPEEGKLDLQFYLKYFEDFELINALDIAIRNLPKKLHRQDEVYKYYLRLIQYETKVKENLLKNNRITQEYKPKLEVYNG